MAFKRTERRPEWSIWAHLSQLRVEIESSDRASLFAPVPEMRCGFAEPSWHPIDHEELQRALGCKVAVWSLGSYSASRLAGQAGRKLVEMVDARATDLDSLGKVS